MPAAARGHDDVEAPGLDHGGQHRAADVAVTPERENLELAAPSPSLGLAIRLGTRHTSECGIRDLLLRKKGIHSFEMYI